MPRALGIFAHPDDLEFLAAGTFLLWAAEGYELGLLLLTSGNRGSNQSELDPRALARTREQEARDAARILGVGEVRFLGHEDGMLVDDLDLRREIAREIRRFRPDVVVAQDPSLLYLGDHYVNHPDHRAAGAAVLAAVYPAAKKPLVFPELLAEGYAPHLVSLLLLAAPARPNLWVDIGEVIDRKIEALLCHRSQFTDQAAASYVRERARANGQGSGVALAETFRAVELRPRSYDPSSRGELVAG